MLRRAPNHPKPAQLCCCDAPLASIGKGITPCRISQPRKMPQILVHIEAIHSHTASTIPLTWPPESLHHVFPQGLTSLGLMNGVHRIHLSLSASSTPESHAIQSFATHSCMCSTSSTLAGLFRYTSLGFVVLSSDPYPRSGLPAVYYLLFSLQCISKQNLRLTLHPCPLPTCSKTCALQKSPYECTKRTYV